MSRSMKCRKVCADFTHKIFTPEGSGKGFITINVEELEAIRLCDLEHMEQEEAARRMEISRGTFQRILYAARKKTAEALCEGKGILIDGGNYEIGSRCCNCSIKCKTKLFLEKNIQSNMKEDKNE